MNTIKEPSLWEARTGIAISRERSDKVHAKVTGCFFIAATVSAIIGSQLYDPLLTDADYLQQGADHFNQIVSGAVSEMILVVTACGTAIMLYPYLKRYNERLALGYFCFRILETVFILLGLVSVLALLTVSLSYNAIGHPDEPTYSAIGTLLKAWHDWTFILGPKFMLGINTFLYSYVFYQTRLVPRPLASLGMTGAILVFAVSLLELFGFVAALSIAEIILVFPVAIYEMILAVWLITRGLPVHHRSQTH